MKHYISHFQAENQFSGAVDFNLVRKFEKVSQSVAALKLKYSFNLPFLVYTKKIWHRIGNWGPPITSEKSLHL